MWAGEQCTPGHPFRVAGRLLSRLKRSVGRPRGRTAAYSWRCCRGKAGHRPRRSVCGERGKRLGLVPRPDHPGRVRAGSSSADRAGTWRSRRSSPRPGKPVTWRRAAASSQCRYWDGRRSPVNTDVLWPELELSLIHISEPTRQAEISYAVFCLKKKKNKYQKKKKKKTKIHTLQHTQKTKQKQ